MRPVPRSLTFALLAGCLCAILAGLAPGAEPAAAAAEASAFDWRSFLAPFHSVTLHLPIGFVMLAFMLDIYYITSPSRELRRAVTVAIIISGLSAALVAGLGFLRAADGGYDPDTLHTHKIYGIAVAVVTLLLAVTDILAYRGAGNFAMKVAYRTLFLVDLTILAIAGHYGGHLTHGSKYLVQNAPEWVQKWMEGFDNTLVIEIAGEEENAPPASSAGYFKEEIEPIFSAKCYKCHGPEKQNGDYRLDNRKDALTAGESELPAIVPFRPRESYLVDLITMPADADEVMPPEGKEALTPEEIVKIIRWIHAGASFGENEPEDVAGP